MQKTRVRYMGGPFDIAAAWGMFCADHAQWDLFGVGALMIEDRQTGQTLGQVGINAGPLFPEHELGWLVYAASEGKGIAFEAATALRNWAIVEKRLPTLVSYVDPENMRSRSLAERLGAFQDETAEKQNETDIVFRHF
jgi:RimJ/RimL family protein N-acetyltransferase